MESPGSDAEQELRQSMIEKCKAMLQKAERAKDRLYKVSLAYPEMRIDASSILHMESVIKLVGSGSFACVFGVPSGSQLQHDDTDDVRSDSDQASTRKIKQQVISTSGTNETKFSAVLKSLQLPIGVQERLTWSADAYNKPSFNQQSIRELELTYDELRWMRMFAKELTSLVACRDHPVAVDCHGWCLDDQVLLPTSVMEFAGGATLWHTLFGTSRPRAILGPVPIEMSWKQCLSVYFQMLDCCDYMHHRLPGEPYQYCVHRDISPGNVVVSWPAGYRALPRIKLVDFGLSQLIAPGLNPGEVFLEDGVAVGPDMMFIDPLMWINKHYGRGTDIFNMAHLMLLMLFGMKAVHQTADVHGVDEYDDARAKFNSVCYNRQAMRNVLRLHPAIMALYHRSCPLLPRWRACPQEILSVLNQQVALCTTAGPDALVKRPSTRHLIRDWVKIRDVLPEELQALLPTVQQFNAQTWDPIGIQYPSPPSPAKLSRLPSTPSSQRQQFKPQQRAPVQWHRAVIGGVDVYANNACRDHRATYADQSSTKANCKAELQDKSPAGGAVPSSSHFRASTAPRRHSPAAHAMAAHRHVAKVCGPAGAATAATTTAPDSARHRDRTPVSYRDPGSGKVLGLLASNSEERGCDLTRRVDLAQA